jgi:hypothetical protein
MEVAVLVVLVVLAVPVVLVAVVLLLAVVVLVRYGGRWRRMHRGFLRWPGRTRTWLQGEGPESAKAPLRFPA